MAESINPIPKQNPTRRSMGTGTNKTVQCNSARVATITNSNAVNEAIKFIKLEKTLDRTNKYLGTYIFLIKDASLIPVIKAEIF